MQREQQHKLMDEMFCPISNQTLPASIEERLELYTRRNQLEDENINYKIIKQKFLNYRQFNFRLLKGKKEDIPAYALSYSTLPRKKAQGKIEYSFENIHYFNREEILFITLKCYNDFFKLCYKNVKALLFNPPSFQEEMMLRTNLTKDILNLSPIIVLDEIITDAKLTLYLDASTYEDIKEKIILI